MSSETVTGAEAGYFKALSEGRFMIQRCGDCNHYVFYPRQFCPRCDSEQLRWVAPKGTGTIYSLTTIRRKAEAGGDYNISLIDLDEGVRVLSRVEGVAAAEARIGMAVAAEVVQRQGSALLVFRPIREGGAR